jgi:hypothetical protein
VGNILNRHGIPPAPEREASPSWRHLMTHYKDQLLACDFFTVETLFLQTLYFGDKLHQRSKIGLTIRTDVHKGSPSDFKAAPVLWQAGARLAKHPQTYHHIP